MTRVTPIVSAEFLILWISLSAQQAPPRDRVVAGHGTVRGRVTTVDGQPLPRAHLRLDGERGGYTTLSNQEGEYEVGEVSADTYHVTATLTGYTGEYMPEPTGPAHGCVAPNETVEHIDPRSRSAIDGRVDETGQPLSERCGRVAGNRPRPRVAEDAGAGVKTNDLDDFASAVFAPAPT
jgi:hypothetical protein